MSRVRVALVAVGLMGLLAAGVVAAVPPYDASKIYPNEAAFMASIKVYQDALAANPRDADAAYWLGDAYWEASVLNRNGSISYGADYLDKSIASLERAVNIDDKYLAAWQALALAYPTRNATPGGTAAFPQAPSDRDKGWAAAQKVLALSRDPGAAYRGVPRAGARNGEVAIRYPELPVRGMKFNPSDLLVVGDADSKLLYQYPCSALPPIAHPALFLSKREAFDRGYRPATVCPPR
jgi:tetratricopeptide (TPR) repeat protein